MLLTLIDAFSIRKDLPKTSYIRLQTLFRIIFGENHYKQVIPDFN